MNHNPEIRLAMSSDTEALVELLRQMHGEAGIGEFSEPKARVAIDVGLRREMAIIGVVRGRRDLEASIGLFLTTPAFSTEQVLSDLWYAVGERYRRSTNAKMLLEFAKWASRELDRPLVMSAIANEQTARKVELMERQLPKAGTVFVYRPAA